MVYQELNLLKHLSVAENIYYNRFPRRHGFIDYRKMEKDSARVLERLPAAKHVFTHIVWRMQGWRVCCCGVPEGYVPVDLAQLSGLPFPSALRTYREIAGEILS